MVRKHYQRCKKAATADTGLYRSILGRRTVLLLTAATALLSVTGCQRALLPSNADRTQFDAYDRRRYHLPPETVLDPFGHEQPNLRERLRPDR
ncbi:MAG TPA: hypothetical protein ENJ06_03610 [Phycisphaeraceae bacterium]|nr:hypothetical protein [Phycisphaeraceae bacterium]